MFTKNAVVFLFLITKIFVISVAAQENQDKISEIRARNQQILEINFRVQKVLNDGIIAFSIKDYDSAIKKFDEGIRLDPDYWGTAPTLLTNKAMTLRTVGVEKYNEAVRQNLKPEKFSRQYFFEAVDSLKKASLILENNTETIPDSEKDNFDKFRFNIVKELAECFRLLALTDKTKILEAVEALENYINVELDPIKKEKAFNELKNLKAAVQK